MTLSEIKKKAKETGVRDTWKYSKKDLIKTIQRKEGNFDCFGTSNGYCDQMACYWRSECL